MKKRGKSSVGQGGKKGLLHSREKFIWLLGSDWGGGPLATTGKRGTNACLEILCVESGAPRERGRGGGDFVVLGLLVVCIRVAEKKKGEGPNWYNKEKEATLFLIKGEVG